MAKGIQKTTSITKKFAYAIGDVTLQFSLEPDKQHEVIAFRLILEKALEDVKNEIVSEQIISE